MFCGRIIQKQVTVNCTAEVLYPPVGQDTAPEVHFMFEGEIGKNPDEEDNTVYQKLKSMKEPLEAQNIPDSFGNISRNEASLAFSLGCLWLYNMAEFY